MANGLPSGSDSRFRYPTLVAIAIAVLFLVTRLPVLGLPPVFQVSEGREGVVVQTMIETGDLVLPLRNGALIPSKPPLFHWIGYALARATGGYTEFELRLPSLISAFALILIIFGFVRAMLRDLPNGPGLAVGSVAVLSSTWGFLTLAEDGRVDMMFCLLLSAAVCLWMVHYERSGREMARMSGWPLWLSSFLIGFSILAKGPLGYVLFLLIVGAWVSADTYSAVRAKSLSSTVRVRDRFAFASLPYVLPLLIAAPWYAAAGYRGGTMFLQRVLLENIGRFSGAEGITTKPWHFYLLQFWLHAAPWSVVVALLAIVPRSARRSHRLPAESSGERDDPVAARVEEPSRAAEHRLLTVCGIWIFVIFAFLNLSAGKRAAYLLLLLPPGAIIAALVGQPVMARLRGCPPEKLERWGLRGCLLVTLLLFAVLIVPWVHQGLEWTVTARDNPSQIKLRMLKGISDFLLIGRQSTGVIGIALILLGACALAAFSRNRSGAGFVVAMYLFLQVILGPCATAAIGGKGFTHGYRDVARAVGSLAPPDQPLTVIKRGADESFDALFFSLGRTVMLFDISSAPADSSRPEGEGYYLSRRSWLDLQPAEWRARIEILHEEARRKDPPPQNVVFFRLHPAS